MDTRLRFPSSRRDELGATVGENPRVRPLQTLASRPGKPLQVDDWNYNKMECGIHARHEARFIAGFLLSTGYVLDFFYQFVIMY